MNIAFYGKGGSGKTTLSALFSIYLDKKGYTVGLLDVDVNSQTNEVLGVKNDKILSNANYQADIRRYLAGTNKRVNSAEFLNTTPPGEGSGLWEMSADNYLTKTYGAPFGRRAHVFTVGSYKPEQVGLDCHHNTQMVAENMISHVKLDKKDVLVIDSVAGNDAFGTSLYLNDILVFVVKPEREGVAVMKRFLELAEHAGVADRVVIVGNQAAYDAQVAFLKREVPSEKLVGILSPNDIVMERRLEGKALGVESIGESESEVFDAILERCEQMGHGPEKRHETLINLHKKVAGEPWVAGAYRIGMEDQIDESYGRVKS